MRQSPVDKVHTFFEYFLNGDVVAASDCLHEKFRSLTNANAASKRGFLEYYSKFLEDIAICDRSVVSVIENTPWVGIVQVFGISSCEQNSTRLQSSDHFRIKNGLIIEHAGVCSRI